MNTKLQNTDSKSDVVPQINELTNGFSSAFTLVDDVVLKNYITRLPDFNVIPLDKSVADKTPDKIRLFKITEMVYEKNESATYKFASVFNSVAAANSAIFAIIDSDGYKTDFYLGIRSLSDTNSTNTSYKTLVNAMKGQFPGTSIENLKISKIKELIDSFSTDSLSAVSCIANNKNKNFVENKSFLQGLEKLALSMQGSKYTAIIIANSTTQEQLNTIRQGYESIYTQLSPFTNTVVSYGTSSTETETTTDTESNSTSKAEGTNETDSESWNTSENLSSETESQQTTGSKVGSTIGSTLSIAGAVIGSIIPGPGTAAGAAIGGAIGGLVGSAISSATNKSVSKTKGGGSKGKGGSKSKGYNQTTTISHQHSLATSLGLSTGETKNMQLTRQNKPLLDMLSRIDKQLERLAEFESIGMWECAAYFLSEDSSVSEVAAATYKALMCGENSGLEVSAINTWDKPFDANPKNKSDNELIVEYVTNFIHPVFEYKINGFDVPIMPTNLVSGNELAIHMGLPRHSVCGFPVIEHIDFGKEVIKYSADEVSEKINIGKIFNMGQAIDKSKVKLDIESFCMHTFISGATGSGKSNTVYKLLDKLISARRDSMNFLVIEPAKGEYKNVFGNKKNVTVLGTNPAYTELLKINPFSFPEGIHVLEHIDRMVEIFNICWPMYAAMPAVLKDAVLSAYENCGWDMINSTNRYSNKIFPGFKDLLIQLTNVIEKSAYSDEVKSNYIGSLNTRVKSLTNGLNGQIFSSDEINNQLLFDSNVIIDLSRIGSQETKSLIIGILLIKLSEYRMTTAITSNQKLKHITVLEEAHNILRNSLTNNNPEGANIAGKSVEMISNAIAEMRTYGEGFIIADQSPNAVDISAIRNTNTKIVMRLPDEQDRRILGKSAGMKDEQLDEIAKLPKGVAVIYQNDWVEPILCKIEKYDGNEIKYVNASPIDRDYKNNWKQVVLKDLLNKKIGKKLEHNIDELTEMIIELDIPSVTKIKALRALRRYCTCEITDISEIVYELTNAEENEVEAEKTDSIEEWKDLFINAENSALSNLESDLQNVAIECIIQEQISRYNKPEEYLTIWKNFVNREVI